MSYTSNSSNVVWTMNYSNIVSSVDAYATTSSNSSTISMAWIINRCRKCKHAHAQEGAVGCYDTISNSIAFVACNCKEHVPEDNLEYLEYLTKKKESI